MATHDDCSAAAACRPQAAQHVLVVPLPLQGHLNPCLSLAHFLASSSISLTLVQPTHSSQTPAAFSSSAAAPSHQITSPSFPIQSIPWSLDPSQPFSVDTLVASICLMRKDVTHLLHQLREKNSPATCLLIDSFFSWSGAVAAEFHLSHITFDTSPASAFSVLCHLPDLVARGFLPATDKGAMEKVVDFIPGLSPFRVADLFFQDHVSEEALQSERWNFFLSKFQNAKSADRVLINTLYELESSAIEALRTEYHCNIVSVGPLFMVSNMTPGRQLQLAEDKDSCLPWLDQQEWCSVLYIAFGTLAVLQEYALAELAQGLEASGERFVWVIRPDAYKGKERVEEILPEGFLERTRGRGRVISWAPQLAVLGHSSVGGFLTHCGWNSVMEGLSNGVPMLGFPHIADQKFNLKLMVHDWKVALPLVIDSRAHHLEKQEQGKSVERRRVEGAIRAMMRGDEGKEVRKRAREWKEVLMKQSSSQDNLQKLAHDLKHGLL